MNLENFIKQGTFNLENVIITDHKTSYTQGLYVKVAEANNPLEYIGVNLLKVNNDILHLERLKEPLNIKGNI